MDGGGKEHGGLVQQILETQKELEDVNRADQKKPGGVEIVSTVDGAAELIIVMLFFEART